MLSIKLADTRDFSMPTLLETLPGLRETYPVGGTPSFFSDRDQEFDFEKYLILDPNELFNDDSDEDNWRIEDWLYPDEQPSSYDGPHGYGPETPPLQKGGDNSYNPETDVLAFYLPFHSYRFKWGVYIYLEGIQRITCALQDYSHAHSISKYEQLLTAYRLLCFHEKYHHAIEVFTTRLETVLEKPCHQDIMNQYRRAKGTPLCYEETCANSYAREKVLETASSASKKALAAAINKFFSGQPAGYREAANTTQKSWTDHTRKLLYLDYLAAAKRTSSSKIDTNFWDLSGNWDQGSRDINDRVLIITRKDSKLAKSRAGVVLELKTGQFKKRLGKLGAKKSKEGARHEKWTCNGNKSVIGRHDSVDVNRNTARNILDQLGLSERWREVYGNL